MIARHHYDGYATADALGVLGSVRMRQGRRDAVDVTREAVELARTADDSSLLSRSLYFHSQALEVSGADPRETLQELMRLYREAGDRIGVERALEETGLNELTAGNIPTARRHLEEAAQLAEELRHPGLTLSVSLNLGLAALLDGDNRVARALFADAVPLARDTEKTAIPYALLGLALTTTADDPEQAARLHATVDRLLAESGIGLEPLEAQLRHQDHQRLKARLGDARFEEALQAGRAQPIDEVITDALRQ